MRAAPVQAVLIYPGNSHLVQCNWVRKPKLRVHKQHDCFAWHLVLVANLHVSTRLSLGFCCCWNLQGPIARGDLSNSCLFTGTWKRPVHSLFRSKRTSILKLRKKKKKEEKKLGSSKTCVISPVAHVLSRKSTEDEVGFFTRADRQRGLMTGCTCKCPQTPNTAGKRDCCSQLCDWPFVLLVIDRD